MIPTVLSDQIRSELERFVREPPEKPDGMAVIARESGVLPALFDWMAFGGIRPDGSVVWVEYDPPFRMTPAEPAYVRNLILHKLAQRYAALATLDPQRPPDAIQCPPCKGTGILAVAGVTRPEFSCVCGGLGWLPPGTTL